MKRNKQELDLLYEQIKADNDVARNSYQPEFPAENPRPADRGFGGDQQAVEHYEQQQEEEWDSLEEAAPSVEAS